MRQVEEMEPQRMQRKAQSRNLHDFQPTKFIEQIATVLEPQDSESPILGGAVRQAMFSWMIEINSAVDLREVGLEPRRTIILHGAPGCGKTTLAHHISARLGVPLVLVNMQTIMNANLGGTGNNIDKLFVDLRGQEKDCVLFLDEFDSIARKRVAAQQACDTEMNNVVIAILQKMDSFKGTLIAATNRSDDIDSAIWRRFSMHVEIDLPDTDCRFAIMKRYLSPYQLADEALDVLTNATKGATPALLRQLSESIKRDMILAPRLKYPDDAGAMIARAIVSAVPHGDMPTPPLWTDPEKAIDALSKHWPPTPLTPFPHGN